MRVNIQIVTLRSFLHLAQLLITQDVNICRDACGSVQKMHKVNYFMGGKSGVEIVQAFSFVDNTRTRRSSPGGNQKYIVNKSL